MDVLIGSQWWTYLLAVNGSQWTYLLAANGGRTYIQSMVDVLIGSQWWTYLLAANNQTYLLVLKEYTNNGEGISEYEMLVDRESNDHKT